MEPLPTNEFLRKLGFAGGNPFSETQAEEEDNLSKYFVDLPAFYKILDMDTGKPRSSVLGADRGCGKSANRKNVERWLVQGPADSVPKEKWCWKHPVLVIPYTDFSRLQTFVQDDFSKLTPEHHVNSILWAGVTSLIVFVEENWGKFSISELDEWEVARLGFYLTHYSERWGNATNSHESKLARKISEAQSPSEFFRLAIENAPQAEKIAVSGSSGLLKGFTEAVQSLGFKSVVVLVDGVDEINITADRPELGALLLKPLIAERVLMQMDGLAFKFFLPNQIIEHLKDIPETRLGERIKYSLIEWDTEAIQELLSQRLRAFSNDKINDLGQIAGLDAKNVSTLLAEHVKNNPRNLLRLAEQVLVKLEKGSISGDKRQAPRITKQVIEDAIEFYNKNIASTDAYASSSKIMPNSSAKWKITPDLHVMYMGRIITTEKLDPKEYEILKYFLAHPGERVERSEIGKAVWKDKWEDRYDWVLSQTILRLRKKIGSERIKTVRGIGYIFDAD